MGSAEFTHWMALDAIDPLPDRRPDYYLAQLAQILFNINRSPGQRALEIEDFLLFKESAPRSADEVEDNIRLIFGGMTSRQKES